MSYYPSIMTQYKTDYNFSYDSPAGLLGVCVEEESITRIFWQDQISHNTIKSSKSIPINTPIVREVTLALDEYFKSGFIDSEISLCPQGTSFQIKVWQALKKIPLGTVKTYGDVAKELQTSSRAVGQACRRNNIPLFIPCHRVVATKGLGGFMGGYRHVGRKRWLLQHEGIF